MMCRLALCAARLLSGWPCSAIRGPQRPGRRRTEEGGHLAVDADDVAVDPPFVARRHRSRAAPDQLALGSQVRLHFLVRSLHVRRVLVRGDRPVHVRSNVVQPPVCASASESSRVRGQGLGYACAGTASEGRGVCVSVWWWMAGEGWRSLK